MSSIAKFVTLCTLFWSFSSASQNVLDFERCLIRQGAIEIDAECASLERLENPEDSGGKTIQLAVVKLASRSQEPANDAFTLIQGGPGGSSVDLLISFSRALEQIRQKRDILVVDQRGTGRSNLLNCPEPDINQPATEPGQIKKLSRECLQGLDSDLRFYTTSVAVQDLDAVREAAGYPQLSIYGVSYGTRVAQHYLRKFPDKTRAVILDGVAHVGLNLAGGEIARRSQAAFESMAERCANDDSCQQKFGDIVAKFGELKTRLTAEPVMVSVPHPVNGEPTEKRLSQHDLFGVIRLMAYSTESNALLPLIISEAHAKNYHPLAAQTLMVGAEFFKTYAVAMNNAVVCAEDAPYVQSDDVLNLENTYFGSQMVEAMRATCEVFPRGVMDDDFLEPFQSDVPALILSGETDPITPPENGDKAAAMLSNSKHLVVPGHGHGVFARGCMPQLSSEFIEQASFVELQTGCLERERATPLFNSFSGANP